MLMHSSRSEDLGEFLAAVYSAKILDPGRYFTVAFNRGESVSIPQPKKRILYKIFDALQVFQVERPKPFQLPSIPENVSTDRKFI